MSPKPLTRRQKEILLFIQDFAKKNRDCPTQAQIKTHFNLSSKATVHQHVETLCQKGYLQKNQFGEISLLQQKEQAELKIIQIPFFDSIPASPPSEIYPSEETVSVPDCFIGNGDHFALRVKGDSMIEADIDDGDMVFIKKQSIAENGQIVAALINQCEMTLKEFRKTKNGAIHLIPHNKSMEPIIINHDAFEIQGVMVGLYRKF